MENMIIDESKQYNLNPKLLKWNGNKGKYVEGSPEKDKIDQNIFYFSGLRINTQQGGPFADPSNTGPNIIIDKTSPEADGVEVSYKFKGGEQTINIVGRTIMQTQPKFFLSDPNMLEELNLSLPKTGEKQHPDMLVIKEKKS